MRFLGGQLWCQTWQNVLNQQLVLNKFCNWQKMLYVFFWPVRIYLQIKALTSGNTPRCWKTCHACFVLPCPPAFSQMEHLVATFKDFSWKCITPRCVNLVWDHDFIWTKTLGFRRVIHRCMAYCHCQSSLAWHVPTAPCCQGNPRKH